MSSSSRKPLSNTTNATSPLTRRLTGENARDKTPAVSGQGLAGSPSVRSTRPTRKPASRSENTPPTEVEDEETRSANTQLIKDLQDQVLKAESASDQFRKQLEVYQQRLDETVKEQAVAEEREHERIQRIVELEVHLKDATQQSKALEQVHEAERAYMLQERDRHVAKETELQSTIVRLNETIRQKGRERVSMIRSTSLQNVSEHDEDPVTSGRHESRDQSDALMERDGVIEHLRLELVDTQIKVAELEHMGDGRLQALEKSLMETRMANARLTEDNDSFQLLLSQKTLKGDFMHGDVAEDAGGLSSLAEELESAGDPIDGQNDEHKRLLAENKSMREGNKALTLYIDKIIGRLLQHEGFEHIIHGQDDPPEVPLKIAPAEKALPPPPDASSATTAPGAGSFLQRARSVVSRPAPPKPRPQSYMQTPTANENPDTAPSIPLNRGHRRTRSDQATADAENVTTPANSGNLGAAAVVQQMNRGSPLRTVSGGTISPLSPRLNPARPSLFQAASSLSNRTTSGNAPTGEKSSSASITSDHSDEKRSTDASSAQTSGHGANIPGAVMKQNQLRPLRLVREQNAISEEEAKKANRGSWMGWFKGSTLEAQQD